MTELDPTRPETRHFVQQRKLIWISESKIHRWKNVNYPWFISVRITLNVTQQLRTAIAKTGNHELMDNAAMEYNLFLKHGKMIILLRLMIEIPTQYLFIIVSSWCCFIVFIEIRKEKKIIINSFPIQITVAISTNIEFIQPAI